MKKKVVLLVAVLAIGVTGFVSAETYGVGASFGVDPVGGLPQQAMLSFKLPQTPLLWGLGAQIGEDTFNVGITGDYWLYTTNLVSFVNLYVGPGFYAALPEPFELGGRVPVGINAYPIEVFEIYFELAPTLVLLSTGDSFQFPDFGLQGAFGFRFWFNA